MKFIFKTLICACLFLYSLAAMAQKTIKEGYISYTASYDLPPGQEMAAAMLPKEYTVFFKGDRSKFTLEMMSMFNTTILSDSKTKESLTLINMAGQKIAVITQPEDKKQQEEILNNIDIKKTAETKELNGYRATKYMVTDKANQTTSELWATTDLITPKSELTQWAKVVEGTLLAFSTEMNGVTIKMSFKEAKEVPVADISLKVPEGYTIKTAEEMQSMYGH